MDTKTTSWVSYLTWVGWLVAYFSGDKEGAKFYLNQSLVLLIFFTGAPVLALIPFLGALLSLAVNIFLLACFIIGLIAAIKQTGKEMPLIGKINILK